jgi:hypothetical protein
VSRRRPGIALGCNKGQVFFGGLGYQSPKNQTFEGKPLFFGLGTPGLQKTTWPKNRFGIPLITGGLAMWSRSSSCSWKSVKLGVQAVPGRPNLSKMVGASCPTILDGFGRLGATWAPILIDFRLRPDLRFQMARPPVCVAVAWSNMWGFLD